MTCKPPWACTDAALTGHRDAFRRAGQRDRLQTRIGSSQKAEDRPPRRCKIIASGEDSASTIASPSVGSLETTAASNAPHDAPAICAKPNKAAATPAFLPNGDRAAALDSGLPMPNPNKRSTAV